MRIARPVLRYNAAMDIQEFIDLSLRQIISAVNDAGVAVGQMQNGAAIVPSLDPGFAKIDFDLAVTITQSDSLDGGAKFNLSVLEAGGKGTTATTSSSVSRIKFTVPVQLPAQTIQEDKRVTVRMD